MSGSRKRAKRAVPTVADASVRQQDLEAAAPLAFDDRLAIFLAFVGSGCLLILEIVAGRLLAPTVGVSLYTWTSVIGVVLAGVSLGNFLGGRLADRRPNRSTVALIYVAASASSLAILGLVHYVESLELPNGAPAIVQVLWLNAAPLLRPLDDPRRRNSRPHAHLAARGGGGRAGRRPDPGCCFGREHRRHVSHRFRADLRVRHAAHRRGGRAHAAPARDRGAAALARSAGLRARLARVRDPGRGLGDAQLVPARERLLLHQGRQRDLRRSRSIRRDQKGKRLPRSLSRPSPARRQQSARPEGALLHLRARIRERHRAAAPRGKQHRHDVPRRRLVHVPALRRREVRRQDRRGRDRPAVTEVAREKLGPRQLEPNRGSQHRRAAAAALARRRTSGSTSSSGTRSTTSRSRTT